MTGSPAPSCTSPSVPIRAGRPNASATSTTSIDRYADVPVRLCAMPRVAESAEEECEPDDEIEDDHRDGHDRVAGDGRVLTRTEHDRGDEDDLDQHDRQGQHERAIRVAEPVGESLGLFDDTERADEDHDDESPLSAITSTGTGTGGSRTGWEEEESRESSPSQCDADDIGDADQLLKLRA